MSVVKESAKIKVWHGFVIGGVGALAVLLWPLQIPATFAVVPSGIAVALFFAWRNK